VDPVVIATAHPFVVEVTATLEFGDDSLHGSLRDSYLLGDFAQPDPGVLSYAEQDMTVIRQEGPTGSFHFEPLSLSVT
jgi:hypothetical protein